MFNLRTTLHRNLGDMGNLELYDGIHVGTKKLIEDYIDEVIKQLNFICDFDIPASSQNQNLSKTPLEKIEEKLEFFLSTQKAFGKTALLLSGGGAFGLIHIGVVKVLLKANILPRIISGSSAGAIVAAAVATCSEEDMIALFDPDNINLVLIILTKEYI
jgi:TAG lipase/steryl ester hydrolase/phospholipase A2/LPA acyltransferase